MRHRHHGLSTYGLNGQRQGDEHPRLCPLGPWHHLPYIQQTKLVVNSCFLDTAYGNYYQYVSWVNRMVPLSLQ